jgi:2-(3-amino-3-carboxypropyl)histidine synthase
VALQFPEGLLMYACMISDILERFASTECVLMGDVTYGACCIDDRTAKALGCDVMIHYGHSCLIPVDVTGLHVLYVFVGIEMNLEKACLKLADYFQGEVKQKLLEAQSMHRDKEQGKDSGGAAPREQDKIDCLEKILNPSVYRVALVGTIQFASSLHPLKDSISSRVPSLLFEVPQERPLSPGEILGCTAPALAKNQYDALLYIGDGRFHLEAMMLANPELPAYRYDPYADILSQEFYDFDTLKSTRHSAILQVQQKARTIGLILSTLGRQGHPGILSDLAIKWRAWGRQVVLVLISEVTPQKLAPFEDTIDAWIQVACPRLSIDWGYAFSKPILSPYEAHVALQGISCASASSVTTHLHPMDFYAKNAAGPWANYHPSLPKRT